MKHIEREKVGKCEKLYMCAMYAFVLIHVFWTKQRSFLVFCFFCCCFCFYFFLSIYLKIMVKVQHLVTVVCEKHARNTKRCLQQKRENNSRRLYFKCWCLSINRKFVIHTLYNRIKWCVSIVYYLCIVYTVV